MELIENRAWPWAANQTQLWKHWRQPLLTLIPLSFLCLYLFLILFVESGWSGIWQSYQSNRLHGRGMSWETTTTSHRFHVLKCRTVVHSELGTTQDWSKNNQVKLNNEAILGKQCSPKWQLAMAKVLKNAEWSVYKVVFWEILTLL